MILEFNGKKPDLEKAAFIADNAVIVGDVVLEEGASVWYGAVIRADTGSIHIGKNTNIQDNCIMHCDSGGRIEVGDHVTVGHGAILHGCTIGDNCMIGMGAIVLNNAVIGKGSLVGAGSLVAERKNYAENMLILGNPARAIKGITKEHKDMLEAAAKEYVRLSSDHGRISE